MTATKIHTGGSSRQAINQEHYSHMTMFAVDMASKYEDGFLPGPGGWLNQDAFYVKLINEALFARRERERIEQQKQAAEAKLKAARSKRR